ncbi:putative serine/threonine protein kinase [Blattamonas nauphoetae]|uniref:Serine/threonine protein kinase n=1 Tax=Blattamonas nauphoetae TaxID=2049346 RepID=A0ABQ9YMB7_9EUKA|nr:putative serine/threonine protein kinase [Blattamonas nauphoetae]
MASSPYSPYMSDDEILRQRGYFNPRYLGQGQFGKVYRVVKDDEFYAAKIVPTKLVSIGESTAGTFLAQQGMTSNYLVNFLECVEIGSNTLFVMDYANLNDLKEANKQTPKMNPSLVLSIAYQLLGGLSVMHRSGLIHRDIKPDNILFHYDYSKDLVFVKISDFGLSKQLTSTDRRNQNQSNSDIMTKTQCGTPIYMAPEAYWGEEEYGLTVDCWALGVTLYEFLAGCHPFDISTNKKFFESVQRGPKPFDIGLGIPQDFQILISQLLSYDPKYRLTAENALHQPCFQSMWNTPIPSLTWEQYAFLMNDFTRQKPEPPPSFIKRLNAQRQIPVIHPPPPSPTPIQPTIVQPPPINPTPIQPPSPVVNKQINQNSSGTFQRKDIATIGTLNFLSSSDDLEPFFSERDTLARFIT